MTDQYATMVQVIELKPGVADFSRQEVGQGIGLEFQKLASRLPKMLTSGPFKGQTWEIVSHDVTRLDRWLLVTLLARKLSKQTS